VRSAQADLAVKAGRSRIWVAGLVLLTLAGVILLTTRSVGNPGQPSGDARPGTAASPLARRAGQDHAAAALLRRLSALLRTGTRRQTVALAATGAPAAAAQLGFIYANVRHLHLGGVSLRYLRRDRPSNSPTRLRLTTRTWAADVGVGWRISGFDARRSATHMRLAFVDTGAGVRFVSARDRSGHPAPLWMLEPLSSFRSSRVLVMVAQPRRARAYVRLARTAVSQVRRVLPSWSGKLVVEVPRSQRQMEGVLGAHEHSYDNVAAATSVLDDASTGVSPTHVVVNPTVFGDLGPNGRQIVLTHEATHVATDAATSSMPMWLLEGFADYVALDHVDLPVSVTASQILAEVAKHGPPPHLPDVRDFDAQNPRVGASYESAWLACRLIAERYGEHRLIELYRQADRDQATGPAFRSVLGTDQRGFTRSWRAYLARLAA
jgi:hypothetical protein